jgi:hypothetical protein
MAKADLLARAEELEIPTTNEEGKELTVPELKTAIAEKEEQLKADSPSEETPAETPEGDVEEPTEAKEQEVKTSKVPRGKTFAEKVADAVPKMAAFVNGRATEKEVKAILKDLVSE